MALEPRLFTTLAFYIDAGKDGRREEKWTTEDEMVGLHH